MPQITLTEEQARALAESPPEMIELRDPQGKVLASVPSPALQDLLETVKRRRAANEPRVPAHKVQAMLQQLDAAHRNGMDEEGLRLLAERLQAEARG
jgi:hypothetical protein